MIDRQVSNSSSKKNTTCDLSFFFKGVTNFYWDTDKVENTHQVPDFLLAVSGRGPDRSFFGCFHDGVMTFSGKVFNGVMTSSKLTSLVVWSF